MKKAAMIITAMLIAAIVFTGCSVLDKTAGASVPPVSSSPSVTEGAAPVSPSPSSADDAASVSPSPAGEATAGGPTAGSASDSAVKSKNIIQNMINMIRDANGYLKEEPAPDINVE